MSLSELRVFGRSGTPISPLTLGTNFVERDAGAIVPSLESQNYDGVRPVPDS